MACLLVCAFPVQAQTPYSFTPTQASASSENAGKSPGQSEQQSSSPPHVLLDLLDKTLNQHPSVQSQKAQRLAADEGVEAARWQYFPSLSAENQRSKSSGGVPYTGSPAIITVRMDQPVWTHGRLSANLGKAEAEQEATQAGLEAASLQLAQRLLQAYADWMGASGRQKAYRTSEQQYLRLIEQVSRRVKEGVSPQSDLVLAQGRLQDLRAEMAVSRQTAATALGRLSQLAGETVPLALLEAYPVEPCALKESPIEIRDAAMEVSPAIRRLRALVRVADAQTDIQKASLLPALNLRAERQWGHATVAAAPPQDRVTFVLSQQLGSGLSAVSAVSAAQARRDAAQADVATEERNIIEQLVTDELALSTAKLKLAALRESSRVNREIFSAWERQFLAGKKSWLDLMNSARELAQADAQSADSQAAWLLSSWRLAMNSRWLPGLRDACRKDEQWPNPSLEALTQPEQLPPAPIRRVLPPAEAPQVPVLDPRFPFDQ
jgi:adhesin transport system outer membrane protein